jgi:hypothetical protein
MRGYYWTPVVLCFALVGSTGADLTIGGQPITRDNTLVYDQLTANADETTRMAIFDAMAATSSETFAFNTLSQAMAHFSDRAAIVNAITGISNGSIAWGIGTDTAVYASQCWMSLEVKYNTRDFKKNNLCKASDAIKGLRDRTTMTECITASKGAILIGLLNSRQDAWIDAFFLQNQPLQIDRTPQNPNAYLSAVVDASVFVPGDLLYMENYESMDYVKQAQTGPNKVKYPEWGGEGCICVGTDSFSGVDVSALSQAGLRARLVQAWKDDANVTLTATQADMIQFNWHLRMKILP